MRPLPRQHAQGSVHARTRRGGWAIARASFVGDNVTLAMHDPRTGDLIAALNHGHFGEQAASLARRRRDVDRDRRAEVSGEA